MRKAGITRAITAITAIRGHPGIAATVAAIPAGMKPPTAAMAIRPNIAIGIIIIANGGHKSIPTNIKTMAITINIGTAANTIGALIIKKMVRPEQGTQAVHPPMAGIAPRMGAAHPPIMGMAARGEATHPPITGMA